LSFSYWIDNLGFITEGKLGAIFIKPSLGVSNWSVIYFINYTPTSFLAPSSPRHHTAAVITRLYSDLDVNFAPLDSPKSSHRGQLAGANSALYGSSCRLMCLPWDPAWLTQWR
jgi:hypothetical protein